MTDLFQILAPMLLIDMLNPVLLGLMIYASGTSRPVANSSALLLGHTLAYFLAGYALSFGVDKISALMENPGTVDYVISLLLGVFCIYWGLTPKKPAATADELNWELTPFKCLLFGSVLNVVGLPLAIPYLGAIDQILKADISLTQAWLVLTVYNVGYALPFSMVPISILVMGKGSKPFLEKLSAGMNWLIEKAMPWLIVLLGLWLLYDAAMYFV